MADTSGFNIGIISNESVPVPLPGSRVQSLNLTVGVFLFMYFVYILYSKKFDRYYVGQCEDLTVRLARHNAKRVLSTKPYVPWEVVYSETYATRSHATIIEKEHMKKKSRH